MENCKRLDKVAKYLSDMSNDIFPSEEFRNLRNLVNSNLESPDVDYKTSAVIPALNTFRELDHPIARKLMYAQSDPVLSTIYNWMQYKVVYAFDDDVEKELNQTHWKDLREIPVNILKDLPIHGFAIALKDIFEMNGDFYDYIMVYCDTYVRDKSSIIGGLFFVFGNTRDKGAKAIIMPRGFQIPRNEITKGYYTTDGITFNDVYEVNSNSSEYIRTSSAKAEFKKMLKVVLPYIVYICTQNADKEQTVVNKSIYKPYKDVPTGAYREVKQEVYGEKAGLNIRNFRNGVRTKSDTGVGSKKAPHVRRSHYHRYWVGSGENRHLEVRKQAETRVHAELFGDILPSLVNIKAKYN